MNVEDSDEEKLIIVVDTSPGRNDNRKSDPECLPIPQSLSDPHLVHAYMASLCMNPNILGDHTTRDPAFYFLTRDTTLALFI